MIGKNAPLPVEREASRAPVRERVLSGHALPRGVVNPHARCLRVCHRGQQIQYPHAVGVPVPQSPLGAKYPRSFGHRIAQTICSYWSCVCHHPKTEEWRHVGARRVEGGRR
jgi:hypothetical protein